MTIDSIRDRSRCVLLSAACTASIASLAPGQARLAELSSNRGSLGSEDHFGSEVARLGDVDGDGIVDMLVAASGEEDVANRHGAVYVISGATGAILRSHTGPEHRSGFGRGLACGADFDLDGVPDYAVSAFGYPQPTSEGAVYVYSGANGALLDTLAGANPGDCFGESTEILGDVDGDGVEDLGIVASGFDVDAAGTIFGRVYVYSGVTFSVLYTIDSRKLSDRMLPVSRCGDVDADGRPDLCIGWYNSGPNNEGRIEVYSGATGAFIDGRIGEAAGDAFGHSVSELGDVDGDGALEFAVRAPLHDIVQAEGRVYVFSGPTRKILSTFDGTYQDERFGVLPASGAIDVNADGHADLLVGSVYFTSYTGAIDSSVFAYSGRTGRLLYEFRGGNFGSGQDSEFLGASVAAVGDFDGDGFDDFIAGAPNYFGSSINEGRAYVFGGNDLFLQADQEEYAVGDALTIANRGGTPGELSLIALTDLNGTPAFQPIVIGALDANGELALSDTVPAGLAGFTLQFTGYARTPGGGVADSIPETITFQ